MAEGDQTQDEKRRRRAAAALRDVRGRLTTACQKFATVDNWRAKVTKFLHPVLDEFADVLPAGARDLLESAAQVSEPTKAGILKSCEMLRGGLESVAREMSAQTGLTGQAQQTLRRITTPVMSLLSPGLRESTLAQALVAAALAAVGIGSITAVAVALAGGGGAGGGPPASSVGSASSPTPTASASAEASPTAGLQSGGISEACPGIAEAAGQGVFGEPAQSQDNADPSSQGCDVWPASRPYAETEDHFHVFVLPFAPDTSGLAAVSELGDEAYWEPNAQALAVRTGETWLSVNISRWNAGVAVAVSLEETKALALNVLEGL
jgi:hypothetical protein